MLSSEDLLILVMAALLIPAVVGFVIAVCAVLLPSSGTRVPRMENPPPPPEAYDNTDSIVDESPFC
ncbi:MAG: hypothetical protein NXI00_11065 [Cytophagales bacterium]|nr:hypothetical protein [Cytophagales bacterium]